MNFFTRCKVFKTILSIIDAMLGIVIAFQIPDIISDFSLVDSSNNRILIFFSVGFVLFIVILLIIALLHCLIKDAEEDLSAVMRLSENSKDRD